ncbi:MAG: hypothetical protein ACHQIL_12700, partial [Steroidobacterales bacterium]
MRTTIERSLGSPENYRVISSRLRFLHMASSLGIPIPKTQEITGAEDLQSWHSINGDAAVLKINHGCAGTGVRISHSPAESIGAFHDLTMKTSMLKAWKQVAIDRDPLAFWMQQNPVSVEVSIQQLIRGRPANSMMACLDGKLLGLVSVVVVAAQSQTGAAVIVRPIKNELMKRNAGLIAKRLQLTGFYGLDYMIDPDTGIPILLELNPRCTQLGH